MVKRQRERWKVPFYQPNSAMQDDGDFALQLGNIHCYFARLIHTHSSAAIIRARVLVDERPLKRAIKKFYAIASCPLDDMCV